MIPHRELKEEAADLLMTAGKEECLRGLQLHSNIPVTDSLSINNTFYEVTVFDLIYPHDVFLNVSWIIKRDFSHKQILVTKP